MLEKWTIELPIEKETMPSHKKIYRKTNIPQVD